MKLSLIFCIVALTGCGGPAFEVGSTKVADPGDGGDAIAVDSAPDTGVDPGDAGNETNVGHDSGNAVHDGGHEGGQGAGQDGGHDSGSPPEASTDSPSEAACVVSSAFQCGDAGANIVSPVGSLCLADVGPTSTSWYMQATPAACSSCDTYSCACLAQYLAVPSAFCGINPAPCDEPVGQVPLPATD